MDGLIGFYDLQRQDFAALSRFYHRTVWTVSDGRVRDIYGNRAPRLGHTVSIMIPLPICFL